MKRILFTENAASPVGPYSQAVTAGGFLFTSGQIPISPQTGQMVEGDVALQTETVFENLQAILKEAGLGLEDVIKTTVYLSDMNDFARFNEVYAGYFRKETAPARSTIEVSRLPKDARIEIEALARLRQPS